MTNDNPPYTFTIRRTVTNPPTIPEQQPVSRTWQCRYIRTITVTSDRGALLCKTYIDEPNPVVVTATQPDLLVVPHNKASQAVYNCSGVPVEQLPIPISINGVKFFYFPIPLIFYPIMDRDRTISVYYKKMITDVRILLTDKPISALNKFTATLAMDTSYLLALAWRE